MHKGRPSISLFSTSPRRRELMKQLKIPVKVCPVTVDETLPEGCSFTEGIQLVSRRKLEEGIRLYHSEKAGWGLAADTLVEEGGSLLGKPADENDARRMLQKLSGQVHQVHTAFSVCSAAGGEIVTSCATTHVRFRPLSGEEIENYLRTEEWKGAAGAYRIQSSGEVLVEKIEGLWSTVVGLPLSPLYGILSGMAYPLV